jgi:hypothetical protein
MLNVLSAPAGTLALMARIIMAQYFNLMGDLRWFKTIGLQNSLSVTLLLSIQRRP